MARPTPQRAKRGIRAIVDTWRECFAEHNLLTWASAIAFQVLVALVPLTLLVFGVLGALDESRVWKKQISPGIEGRLPKPTFDAVNYAVEKILTHATFGLLAFAAVLTVWEVSGSVRAIGGALNQIYDTKRDPRPLWLRVAISSGIAVAIGACFLGAVLVLTLSKHAGGSLEALLGVGRWLIALVLLGVAVNVLLRFAPAEPRSERWLSAGSAFIIVSWAVMSVIFRVYVTSIASFMTAWGTFVTVLVLTAYLKISAVVFLVGAQADELVRKDASPGETGLFQRMRAAFG
jgi:membrane protein